MCLEISLQQVVLKYAFTFNFKLFDTKNQTGFEIARISKSLWNLEILSPKIKKKFSKVIIEGKTGLECDLFCNTTLFLC